MKRIIILLFLAVPAIAQTPVRWCPPPMYDSFPAIESQAGLGQFIAEGFSTIEEAAVALLKLPQPQRATALLLRMPRSGYWIVAYRGTQSDLDARALPIHFITTTFSPAPDGERDAFNRAVSLWAGYFDFHFEATMTTTTDKDRFVLVVGWASSECPPEPPKCGGDDRRTP